MIINEPTREYSRRVLGGISFGGDRIDAGKVSVDIERVCEEFTNKETHQKMDSE